MDELFDTRLPMNRKERYFTGTVLPMMICAHDFAYFDRFLEMVGTRARLITPAGPDTNIEFFTEYGFVESLMSDTSAFPSAGTGRDTPDVVVYIEDDDPLLIGVEAKMYDRPTTVELEQQLAIQAALLDAIAEDLPGAVEVCQVALLPAQLSTALGALPVKTITWEEIVERFRDVAPVYWSTVLGVALSRYSDLVSAGPIFGAHAHAKLSGEEIVRRYRNGDSEFAWVGRSRGLGGPELAKDVESGRWRTQRYEVRRGGMDAPNRNWFSISEFVARVSPDDTPRPAPWTVRDAVEAWSRGDLSFADFVLRLAPIDVERRDALKERDWKAALYEDADWPTGPNSFWVVSSAHTKGLLSDEQLKRAITAMSPPAAEWQVSLVVTAWPEGLPWTGAVIHHFHNGTFRDGRVCLDYIEAWAEQGRRGNLPQFGSGVPTEVHGFVGVQRGGTFVPLVQWTPYRLYGREEPLEQPRDRPWAEAELDRYLQSPTSFVPDRDAWLTWAEGTWNKVHRYRGFKTASDL